MRVSLKFRDLWRAVSEPLTRELDQLVASIRAGWNVEHYEDGTHKVPATFSSALTDMGGQVYNVLAYGATGNGGTDDTAAIQSAIAACAPGGTVFLPHGTYRITSPLILSGGISLVGCGFNVAGGPPLSSTVIRVDLVDTFKPAIYGHAVSNVRLSGFYVDGRASGTGHEIVFDGHSRHLTLDHCYIVTAGTGRCVSLAVAVDYVDTSATSVTVGTGIKTFAVTASKPFVPGMWMRITSTGSGAWMDGIVMTYTGTVLVMTIYTTNGAGAHTDWATSVPSSLLMSTLTDVRTGGGTNGIVLGPLVTSTTLIACYPTQHTGAGFVISGYYNTLAGCGTEYNEYGYHVLSGYGVALTGCGAEVNDKSAFLVTGGSFAVNLLGCRASTNNAGADADIPSFLDVQASNNVTLIGCVDQTPTAGTVYSTASTTEDCGLDLAVLSCSFTLPQSTRFGCVMQYQSWIKPSSLTETQRDALADLPPGAMVYNLDTDKYNFWNGANWELVPSATGPYASGGALDAYGTGAFGFDSAAHASELHALVVNIRAALVANGIMS